MLQAGFARVDITPPFGNDLSGYYERRLADGTLDPLYLNAVALTVGEETLILMAADYIGIKMDHNVKIREMICARTGVPTDHIMIAALHQDFFALIAHVVSSGNDFRANFCRFAVDGEQPLADGLFGGASGHQAAVGDVFLNAKLCHFYVCG